MLAATAPPERRGLSRDAVRLLVARGTHIEHHAFSELPALLRPGDGLIINTSATLPAALHATFGGRCVPLHVSTQLDDGSWVVEIRLHDNTGPDLSASPGAVVETPDGTAFELVAAFPDEHAARSRLWRARLRPQRDLVPYLLQNGAPIRYGHLQDTFPLSAFQNVYAAVPGSAEMASAGRPLSHELLTQLSACGVLITPLVLHAGVSSPELHEPPAPERYAVSPATAALVNTVHRGGGRVVAVGTTVVRALESAAAEDGSVHAAAGWTDLVLGPLRRARAVDALLTGIHEPESSHLNLLRAVAGEGAVAAAYRAAEAEGYLGHEFGDSMLFLPR